MKTAAEALEEVLPCPCCGYRAAIEQVPPEIDDANAGGYYIECKRAGCGITTRLAFALKDDPIPSLIKSWNQRAALAPPQEGEVEPRKVMQTEFGVDGNCQSACIATITGIPLDAIPNFTKLGKTDLQRRQAMCEWLWAHGWGIVTFVASDTEIRRWYPGFVIAGGESARGIYHGVVYKDGELWHDPHPDGTGLTKVEDCDILYRLLRATQSNGHSPVGDESPRQNAKGAEGCHDAPNASGESPAQSSAAPTQPAAPVQEPVRYTMWSTSDGYVNPRADPEGAWVLYAAPSAPAQEPTITVSGPVACGKSYVMELIYKALRNAGLHPYSDELAHERRMVEEQPQPAAKVWRLRESVYAAPPPDEARELLRALEPHLDKLICYASTTDEYEPNAIVARIRAFLKDRT